MKAQREHNKKKRKQRMSATEERKTDSFNHSIVGEVGMRKVGNGADDVALDFPMENIPASDLPSVTIVTVTRNRKKFFPIALDNWHRIYYPHDKLTWLVVDDSDTIEMGPVRALKEEKDERIKYYYHAPQVKDDGEIVPASIGAKRNLAMELVDTDLVVLMDDDDFMYNDSILARVCTLVFYKKQCVYSDKMGVYDVKQKSSYVLEGYKDVPECSMMFTKNWWSNGKFLDTFNGEGMGVVLGRESDCIKIPFFFNCIMLNHDLNTTERSKYINISQKDKDKMKDTGSDFSSEFPVSFTQAVKDASLE